MRQAEVVLTMTAYVAEELHAFLVEVMVGVRKPDTLYWTVYRPLVEATLRIHA